MIEYVLFANSRSGNYSPEKIEEIERPLILADGQLQGRIITTNSLPDLEDEVRKIHERKIHEQKKYPGIAGFFGGDASVMEGMTAVENIWENAPDCYIAFPEAGGTMMNVHEELGVKGGITDYLKKVSGFGDTTSVQLAKYLAQATALGEPLKYKTIPAVEVIVDDIKNKKCQTIGFGIVPNLLSLYEGMTIEQCLHLERELQQGRPEEYHQIAERYTEGLQKPSKLSALRTGISTFGKIFVGSSRWEEYFFSRALEVEITLDGEKLENVLPKEYRKHPPTGVYAASFGKANIGLPLKSTLLPQANKDSDRIPVVFTFGTAQQTALSAVKTFVGMKMDHTSYLDFTEMVIESKKVIACNLNGDSFYGRHFKIRADGKRHFIVGK